MKDSLIEQVNGLFIATPTLQGILDDIKDMRRFSKLSKYENEPMCMLVTGETGTGKSEFIKQYLSSNKPVAEEERTKIPVLVSLIPKVKHPKPVVAQLLRDLGDPLEGMGGDSSSLLHRLITLLKGTSVELIILDEFQHLIETKSNQVVYDIADLIKILVSKAKIPVVLFGLPWSSHILTVNSQLERRFRLQHKLINYTLDTFNDFQKFLGKVQEKLPIKPEMDLRLHENAFRFFAASEGNVANLMNCIIRPAAIDAIDDASITDLKENKVLITNKKFAMALKHHSQVRNELNPFLIDINEVVANVQGKDSYWNTHAAQGESRVVDMTYAKIKFSDLSLNDVFSRK